MWGWGGEGPPKKQEQFIPVSQGTVGGKITGRSNPIADTGYTTA